MRKKFLLAFLFLSLNFCFGQNYTNQLKGCWVNYKTEIKSDSTNITKNNYLNFTFNQNKLYMNIDPTVVVSNFPVAFEMKSKLIKTSIISESGYIIEKITNDSLILSDSFENKAKRYYFINEKILCNNSKIETENKDIFLANYYCTPKQKQSIEQYIFSKLKGKIKSPFKIEGTISINIEEKKVKSTVSIENIHDDKMLNKIVDYLNETYNFWNLENFQQYKSIEIPFKITANKVNSFENLQIKFL
jgi:hypothetical protein